MKIDSPETENLITDIDCVEDMGVSEADAKPTATDIDPVSDLQKKNVRMPLMAT